MATGGCRVYVGPTRVRRADAAQDQTKTCFVWVLSV